METQPLLQFYKVAWRARLTGGWTSSSSLELEEQAPPEESPEDEAAGVDSEGLLDPPELSLLVSCQ